MEEQKEMITISKEEYDHLVESSSLLDALFAAGVENWEGFGAAVGD